MDLKTGGWPQAVPRRKVLTWAAGAVLAGSCAGPKATAPDGSVCMTVPDEPGGPYPADGSNGINVLTEQGIVRRSLHQSFGSSVGEVAGVALTLRVTLINTGSTCEPLAGRAVYLWHANAAGRYSLYEDKDQNWLRGVQELDATGTCTFQTIFPGCYKGRYPHIHFEIFPGLSAATSQRGNLKTSELTFPTDVCGAVYETPGYEASGANFAKTSLRGDILFGDGAPLQLVTVTGTPASGLVGAISLGVPS